MEDELKTTDYYKYWDKLCSNKASNSISVLSSKLHTQQPGLALSSSATKIEGNEIERENSFPEKMEDPVAIIIGAGPSGLATSACLNHHSIPHIVLEREDCYASLWRKYTYDRLHLHLRKQFCELPHVSFPDSYPAYVPKNQFLQYLEDYVSRFKISPMYQRSVEFASFDEEAKKWNVKAKNVSSGEVEEYSARFLVVASGETSNPFIPELEGLNTFSGEFLHSTKFKNGKTYRDKNVLVVGSGNSGMEIALDLANHGARTSIAIRSPVTYHLARSIFNLFVSSINY